ncbi:MAG TPA: SRPBCC family protein [Acidobacteriota bacterium]|nr:SRPBCC family protein [Acidobacteriota bacterium]
MTQSEVKSEADVNKQVRPVRKTIEVDCPRDQAFEIFTARISDWWPLATYSISQERAASCGFEPRVGGKVYEVRDDGQRFEWGTLLAWDAPRRIAMTWHPGYEEDKAQKVEVQFHQLGSRTRVELVHSGWEVLGEKAEESRNSYEGGWEEVLKQRYAQACRR